MKRFTQQRKFTILTLLLFVFFSCDNEENTTSVVEVENSTPNIVVTADATDALSSLVAALSKADEKEGTDLIGTLSGDGPFTVFAPTNEAFTALLEGLEGFDSLDDFDTDEEKDLLATILTYHVVSGTAALSTDLSDGQMIKTVQEEEVTISLTDGVFVQDATEDAAQVVIADVEASNGVVHVIDKVLIPQAVLDALAAGMDTNTLVDIVVATDALSILKDAVLKADLAGTLSSEGPFTVFAPTNDAFVALLEVLGDDYNSLDDFDTEAEIALLKNILLYHVVPAKVLAADLAPGDVGTALMDNSVAVIASGDTFVIGDASDVDANITGTDIMASNGVAHTIDKVLLPQEVLDFLNPPMPNIVGLAQSVDNLSLLVDALIQADAGLVDVLSGDGPFTVFAPTNDAFAALLDALGDDYNSLTDFDTAEEKVLLAKVLTYHVVSGTKVASGDLTNDQEITTVQGEALVANIDHEIRVFDKTGTPSNIIAADNLASNGIVHIIDKVLLPQEVLDALAASDAPNIVALAQSVDNLSLLVDALIQADAGLVEVLSGNGPFTVFAPTNEAFASLLEDLGDDYNSLADFDTQEEKDLLATILTYHVSAGEILESGDFVGNEEIATVQGEALVASTDHEVRIFDKTGTPSNIIGADNMASNGIVHIVDKVVLPRAVLDILNHQ